jgi:hypothetical protein
MRRLLAEIGAPRFQTRLSGVMQSLKDAQKTSGSGEADCP